MSREIQKDFDTIFWASIEWKNIYIYLTKLKSRIYKAAHEKSLPKISFLQHKLLQSVSIRYLILKTILDNQKDYFLDKKIYQNHICFLEQYENDKFMNYCIVDGFLKTDEIYSDRYKLLDSLVYLALEPQLDIYRLTNKNFKNLALTEEFVNTLSQYNSSFIKERYFYDTLSIEEFLKNINVKYLVCRLTTAKVIHTYIYDLFKQKKIIEYCHAISSYQYLHYFKSYIFQSTEIICEFVKYALFIEVSYLTRIYSFKSNNEIKCISSGTDILFYHKNQQYLAISLSIFSNLIKSSIYVANFYNNVRYENISRSYTFCGYYVCNKYYGHLLIGPAKQEQKKLLQNISLVFDNMQGQSLQNLVSSLNIVLSQWLLKFYSTKDHYVFSLIDYLILKKLIRWIRRRKIKGIDNNTFFFSRVSVRHTVPSCISICEKRASIDLVRLKQYYCR